MQISGPFYGKQKKKKTYDFVILVPAFHKAGQLKHQCRLDFMLRFGNAKYSLEKIGTYLD